MHEMSTKVVVEVHLVSMAESRKYAHTRFSDRMTQQSHTCDPSVLDFFARSSYQTDTLDQIFSMASQADASAPESTLPYPPLYKDAPFVVLSDWSVKQQPYRSSSPRVVG